MAWKLVAEFKQFQPAVGDIYIREMLLIIS